MTFSFSPALSCPPPPGDLVPAPCTMASPAVRPGSSPARQACQPPPQPITWSPTLPSTHCVLLPAVSTDGVHGEPPTWTPRMAPWNTNGRALPLGCDLVATRPRVRVEDQIKVAEEPRPCPFACGRWPDTARTVHSDGGRSGPGVQWGLLTLG